jgi:hypothetical protein
MLMPVPIIQHFSKIFEGTVVNDDYSERGEEPRKIFE